MADNVQDAEKDFRDRLRKPEILQRLLDNDDGLKDIVAEFRKELRTRKWDDDRAFECMMIKSFNEQPENRHILQEALIAAESAKSIKSTELSRLFDSFQPPEGSEARMVYKKAP